MKIRILATLAIAATLLSCGGEKKSGAGAAGDKNTLVIAFDGPPTSLDPRVGPDTYCGRVWALSSSGLIKLMPSGDFPADVAQKWETPDDKTIVFHLNPNAKFQDGKPVTSKDFKFTFDSLMSPNFQSAKKSGYSAVASFEAPDDHTLIVKLSEPNAGIFDNFPQVLVPQGADTSVFSKT